MRFDQLCCDTGYAFLDIWTAAHFGFWVFVASTFWALRNKFNRWVAFGICFALSLGWEVFESFAETAWPNIWLDPESGWNSWVSDPLTCVVAFLLMYWGLDHRPRRAK